jgi:hypothetical protein
MNQAIKDFAFQQYTRLLIEKANLQRAAEEGFCVTAQEYNRVIARKNRAFEFIAQNGGAF